MRHEDRVVAQGSIAGWSGGAPPVHAATYFYDSAYERGGADIWATASSQIQGLYTSVLNVPTGYTNSLPIIIKYYTADTAHTATLQLQSVCWAAGTAVATLTSSWANLGSPITLSPAGTASEIVTISNTESLTCAAGNDLYINIKLTASTFTSDLYVTFVGLYPTASTTTP